MILYIMRHAEAVAAIDTLPDQWRFLTEAGRTASKKVCTAVARYGPKTRLIVTSPLTRAVQTAEIAAGVACRRNRVIASELLLPGTDVTALKTFLRQQHEKRVMVVGHEPLLGALVADLLKREKDDITLKKGACVALKLNPEQEELPADFLWYLSPGKRLVTSVKKAFAAKQRTS